MEPDVVDTWAEEVLGPTVHEPTVCNDTILTMKYFNPLCALYLMTERRGKKHLPL